MEKQEKEKWIKHYSSSHKILLVGEGDFSFSACLAKVFGSADNMISTSLDSEGVLMTKHPTAMANIKELKKLGCTILHNVNCHTMSRHRLLKKLEFDRIVYNFPHAGLLYQQESQRYQIKLHQKVVKGFFGSARDMLTAKGEAHVTHKTTNPFNKWEVEKLAEEAGLCLVEEVEFTKLDYPGYHNKKGYGKKSNRTFRVGNCSTFKFALPSDTRNSAVGVSTE